MTDTTVCQKAPASEDHRKASISSLCLIKFSSLANVLKKEKGKKLHLHCLPIFSTILNEILYNLADSMIKQLSIMITCSPGKGTVSVKDNLYDSWQEDRLLNY